MLIRPRFTDYHGVHVPQSELEFAIPFLDEDIPLYVDPFLLWKSPSFQDNALHNMIIDGFNHIGVLSKNGNEQLAISQIIAASECDEVGLGNSATKKGKRIGRRLAETIISLFKTVPYYRERGFRHIEELALLVDGIGKDRISDIACNYMKSFLIDFTIQEAKKLGIPLQNVSVSDVFSPKLKIFETISTELPVHPENGSAVIFVPKRWLRHVPWINFDIYFKKHCPQDDVAHEGEDLTRVGVLTFNRDHYDVIDKFVLEREKEFEDCKNDPLFTQIPVISARRKLSIIKKLETGNKDKADKLYEDAIAELFASLFYPHLDFAKVQARTDSGVSIRDLIFYNSRTNEFLKEIMEDYGSRQITMEMKNVKSVGRENIDQLNRYLHEELGKFGVLVTRNELKRPERTRVIDLWSGQRKAIVTLTDMDVEQMVEVFESKQRSPLDILKKKYVDFKRLCP